MCWYMNWRLDVICPIIFLLQQIQERIFDIAKMCLSLGSKNYYIKKEVQLTTEPLYWPQQSGCVSLRSQCFSHTMTVFFLRCLHSCGSEEPWKQPASPNQGDWSGAFDSAPGSTLLHHFAVLSLPQPSAPPGGGPAPRWVKPHWITCPLHSEGLKKRVSQFYRSFKTVYITEYLNITLRKEEGWSSFGSKDPNLYGIVLDYTVLVLWIRGCTTLLFILVSSQM